MAEGRETEWSQWMAAAQDGDRAAYERLLRDIVPFVRRIAAHYARAADQQEDIVQDVLLTVHRVRHTYDPARPFSHWLGTVAKRRAIDMLRRRGRRDRIEVFDDFAYETFSDPAANEKVEAHDQLPGLQGAIATLPEAQREAIELLKLKELSLNEASQLSGRSTTSLKVNAHRALKALRARLMKGE